VVYCGLLLVFKPRFALDRQVLSERISRAQTRSSAAMQDAAECRFLSASTVPLSGTFSPINKDAYSQQTQIQTAR
jgi:hypothetical protein